MARATWNGALLAESDHTILVEGNRYFPPDSVRREFLRESDRHTVCSWKGVASYYDVEVDGQQNQAAAWYYPEPSPRLRRSRITSLSDAASGLSNRRRLKALGRARPRPIVHRASLTSEGILSR